MKVAVVGGNFLGCSTAHYLRKVLDERRKSADHNDPMPSDEIVIFEKLSVLGGNKFSTDKAGGIEVLTGTAAGSDTSTSPMFSALLKDAGIELPLRRAPSDWAIFDWDRDQYRLTCLPSRILNAVAASALLRFLLHVFCVSSTAFFARMFQQGEFQNFLWRYTDVHTTMVGAWMAFLVLAGFGLVPLRILAEMYNRMIMASLVKLAARFKYGASLDMAREVVSAFAEHLQTIHENDSSESSITIGHLVARCGLNRYVSKSASERLESFHISEAFRNDILAPVLATKYKESRFRPNHIANSVVSLLELMTSAPVPAMVRGMVRQLSVNQTKTLCPELLSAARASLQVCTEVVGVCSDDESPNKYVVCVRTAQGESKKHGFDAVILAATVDASTFNAKDVVENLAEDLAQTVDNPAHAAMEADGSTSRLRQRNTAACMSLVVGDLQAAYFSRRTASSVATRNYVVNSVDCSEVVRVAPRVYLVISADKLDEKSELVSNLFDSVDHIKSWERSPGRYIASPIRTRDGPDVPAIVIASRFLNAAAIDRIGDHVELDCLAARNAASFFKEGVVKWL